MKDFTSYRFPVVLRTTAYYRDGVIPAIAAKFFER